MSNVFFVFQEKILLSFDQAYKLSFIKWQLTFRGLCLGYVLVGCTRALLLFHSSSHCICCLSAVLLNLRMSQRICMWVTYGCAFSLILIQLRVSNSETEFLKAKKLGLFSILEIKSQLELEMIPVNLFTVPCKASIGRHQPESATDNIRSVLSHNSCLGVFTLPVHDRIQYKVIVITYPAWSGTFIAVWLACS